MKCSIIPFQSAAFTLGCDEALVRLKTGNKKEKEGIYNGLCKFHGLFSQFYVKFTSIQIVISSLPPTQKKELRYCISLNKVLGH